MKFRDYLVESIFPDGDEWSKAKEVNKKYKLPISYLETLARFDKNSKIKLSSMYEPFAKKALRNMHKKGILDLNGDEYSLSKLGIKMTKEMGII